MIALSYSRLSDYHQCPLKFKLKYLDKSFPDESDSPHLVRGSNVHKQLENYAVKKMADEKAIPPTSLPEVESTKPLIDSIFEHFDEILPETQLAVDREWKKVEWYAKDAYYRCIIDLGAMGGNSALLVDWKTGKIYDYAGWGGQLHLSGTMVMSAYPNIEEIVSAYVYVDHKKKTEIKITRQEVPALIAYYDKESEKVNSDKEFAPKPNEMCKWCPATKSQCKYSRKM